MIQEHFLYRLIPVSNRLQLIFDFIYKKMYVYTGLNDRNLNRKLHILTYISGIHPRQVISTCPMVRMQLESTIESIIDAGMSPAEFKGRKVNVYVSISVSEHEYVWMEGRREAGYFGATGWVHRL